MTMKCLLPFIAAISISAGTMYAAEDSTEDDGDRRSEVRDFFSCGRFEAAVTSGVLFSPFIPTGRPPANYTQSALQLGYMLTDPVRLGFLRGNLEIAGEAFGGAIFKGEGSYVTGGTVWLRGNLVIERSRFVPYVQAGAGLTCTDVNRDLTGQNFNFNLDLGAGVRYFVTRNCSVNLEYRYQHISNARMSNNDLGVNAHGPMLGLSFFF
jgi:opacity protein-like surface antigen